MACLLRNLTLVPVLHARVVDEAGVDCLIKMLVTASQRQTQRLGRFPWLVTAKPSDR